MHYDFDLQSLFCTKNKGILSGVIKQGSGWGMLG